MLADRPSCAPGGPGEAAGPQGSGWSVGGVRVHCVAGIWAPGPPGLRRGLGGGPAHGQLSDVCSFFREAQGLAPDAASRPRETEPWRPRRVDRKSVV